MDAVEKSNSVQLGLNIDELSYHENSSSHDVFSWLYHWCHPSQSREVTQGWGSPTMSKCEGRQPYGLPPANPSRS